MIALRRARAGLGNRTVDDAEFPRGDRDAPDWFRDPPTHSDNTIERVSLPSPASPIMTHGELVGAVLAPTRPPYSFLLVRFGPVLAVVAAAVLVMGTALTSLVVFGPPRRRLHTLEAAARKFGAGDLSARAPDGGSDEISAVAQAFNAMASDLSARAEALDLSQRARRQLLADVSHELNTPVTAMRGYLETLTMADMELNEATRHRYLGIVLDETARLERIIGDLLDLARLEDGGGSLNVAPVKVSEVFDRVAARHERACADVDVTLKTSIARGAETVVADRDRLEQAVQNLAANALRYAPRASSIDLAARRNGDGVVFSVADTGPGIPAEHLPHVFDRFYKAESSRKSAGSGLGLSIVKAIIEQHGGRVGVTSEPGRTVFELTIHD
jgi:two-component system sensor histidine kinase BaeS